MNGAHDLGGMHGLGPIHPEAEGEEPVFHHDWEKRVFGLTLGAGALGFWNLDMSRQARERQHPVDYLRHSYYENWLAGLERLLVETGLVTAEELATGQAAGMADEDARSRLLKAGDVERVVAHRPKAIAIDALPRFKPGDRVRALNRHPPDHTREPRYVRGRVGVIHEHYGAQLFPDSNAIGSGKGLHVYCVRFEASELWGDNASSGSVVYVDLWEEYLESAG